MSLSGRIVVDDIRYDDVVSEMVNCAADMFEADMFVLPEDKHTLLRTMPYCLLLMDGNDANNVFRSKKIKLSRFAAIFNFLFLCSSSSPS